MPRDKENLKAWIEKTREHRKAYRKKYREETKERYTKYNREYGKNWRLKNKEWKKKYQKEYYQKNKERERNYREGYRKTHKEKMKEYHLKHSYNLTILQMDEILVSQGHKCAICKKSLMEIKRYVDHDHGTGKVRGILCHRCNLRLAGIEDTEFFRIAIKYLGGENG